MKKLSLDEKLQVCGYCSKFEKDPILFNTEGYYCKEKRMDIPEIKSCPAWSSFWGSIVRFSGSINKAEKCKGGSHEKAISIGK